MADARVAPLCLDESRRLLRLLDDARAAVLRELLARNVVYRGFPSGRRDEAVRIKDERAVVQCRARHECVRKLGYRVGRSCRFRYPELYRLNADGVRVRVLGVHIGHVLAGVGVVLRERLDVCVPIPAATLLARRMKATT